MTAIERGSFGAPHETRKFDNGKAEILSFDGATVGKITLEPGWRWSDNIKPIVGGDRCQQLHLGYVVSGRMHVAAEDGSELETGPGDAYVIQPGHDAWVVGDETFSALEFSDTTAQTYAKG